MTKWHIKEISELTKTSIRMLRHYDKIGLLQPSYREANGYRCYTAPDLAKLQQIVALRYFGFSLSTIKDILQKHTNIYAHLQAQQHIIQKESMHLNRVNEVLKNILKNLPSWESPDLNDLLLLIEEYNMSDNLRDKLKKSWAGEKLTESQFESYLFLYEQFPEEFAKRDAIIDKINRNLVGDPEGEDGEAITLFMHDLAKKMKNLFTEQVKLGSSLLESIQSGKLTQLELTPEGLHWMARASLAYWLKRWNKLYDEIAANIKHDPNGKKGKELANAWRGLTDEYLSAGSRDFVTGILLWQEFARQDDEIKKLKTMPSPQEMLKQCHVKLLFHPEASAWICQALDAHSS